MNQTKTNPHIEMLSALRGLEEPLNQVMSQMWNSMADTLYGMGENHEKAQPAAEKNAKPQTQPLPDAASQDQPNRHIRLVTAESVRRGHPDKLCDQIADAILDAHLEKYA